MREAARRYGVPRTTLQRKLSKDAAGGSGVGSRSNSVTSPETGAGGSDSASPTSSNPEHMPQVTSAASASAYSVTTPNSVAAAISSAIDANQSTMNTILGLYESNGNGTTPVAFNSSMSRKRPAEAMNAPEKQQPVSKGTPFVHHDQFFAKQAYFIIYSYSCAFFGAFFKGPHKAINCKVRMLCTSAGSALDELSNEMIMEGKCIYKLGLGQSPFPIPQCVVDELRYVIFAAYFFEFMLSCSNSTVFFGVRRALISDRVFFNIL